MTDQREYAIVEARIIDPDTHLDTEGYVQVRDGTIVAAGPGQPPGMIPSWSAPRLLLCPGLIDVHVHLREPGGEHKETIATGCRAAVVGGFTAVCCMPNTTPPLDNPATLGWVRDRAAQADRCRVHPIAALTRGRTGHEVTDFGALTRAGAIAFSDDGSGVEDAAVMRAALARAAACGALVCPHCEFASRTPGAAMHQGETSKRLGLIGVDPRAEEDMIARDIDLAAETGSRCHVTHVSTARGWELIRAAKARALPITAEVTPHHLLLTDADVVDARGQPNPDLKMNPPLRPRADVEACLAAARSGLADCVASDHAPHTPAEKSAGFPTAPNGVIGLETALACTARALLDGQRFGWPQLIERMSTTPARIFRLPGGTLRPGSTADLTLIDPAAEWTIDPAQFASKSRNTPFAGWRVRGRAVATVVGGRFRYLAAELAAQWRSLPPGLDSTGD